MPFTCHYAASYICADAMPYRDVAYCHFVAAVNLRFHLYAASQRITRMPGARL